MTTELNSKQLDKMISLLQHLLAIQLYLNGVNQAAIAKKMGVATVTVNEMLKGLKKNN